MAFRWRADLWPNIECWLGSFAIFKGIRTRIARKPYIFVIFQGGGRWVRTPCPPPSLDSRMLCMESLLEKFKDSHQDSHLGYRSHFFINLNVQITLMPASKFRLNLRYSLGVVFGRISIWLAIRVIPIIVFCSRVCVCVGGGGGAL